jgi:hypothetical protein
VSTPASTLTPGPPEPPGSALLRLLLLALVLQGLTVLRYGPPDPLGTDASPEVFSAGRAMQTLERLIPDDAPHPVGSPENLRVRKRLEHELRTLGLEPVIQDAFQVSQRYSSSAQISNVMAKIQGREAGYAVLLLAHYDSREAAPGAGDDGAGVAVLLEIARALLLEGQPQRSVILLVTDGEEAGLIGADAFIQQHAWIDDVGVVLNLEGRGNSGPSLMFETGPDNGELARRWANASLRPVGTSVFSTFYRRLPNNTDFTPFLKAKKQGLNFAYIGNVAHYHTTHDTVANLNRGSVQHHGDNLLNLVRDLANGPALSEPGDSVYFDVFAWFVIGWPEGLSPWLALLALLLLAYPAFALARLPAPAFKDGHPDRLRVSHLAWGGVALFGGLLLAGGLTFAASLLLDAAGATPTSFVAHPLPHLVLLVSLATLAFVGVGLVSYRATFWGTFLTTWGAWGMLGLLTALTLPGLCYLFVVPSLIAGIAATLLLRFGGKGGEHLATPLALAPTAAALSLLLPTFFLLTDSMGIGPRAPAFLVACLLLFPCAPLFARQRLLVPLPAVLGLVAIAAAAFAFALAVPPYTPEAPRRLTWALHVDADAKSSRWILATPPPIPAEAKGHDFGPEPVRLFPWSGVRAYVAKGPSTEILPPELTEVSVTKTKDGRRVQGVLRSRRGAIEAALFVPKTAELTSIRLQGQTPKRRHGANGWSIAWCNVLPPGGLRVDLEFKGTGPVELTLLDATIGLPERVAPALLRTPESVSSYKADRVVVSTQLRF